MSKNNNINKTPDDSMAAESSRKNNESNVFLTNELSEAQIDELVQNLYVLTRDQDIGVYTRCMECIQNWLNANLDFEVLNKKDAFFQGFYVGGRFIQKLYKKE